MRRPPSLARRWIGVFEISQCRRIGPLIPSRSLKRRPSSFLATACAVARSQSSVHDLTRALRERGGDGYASPIHPVRAVSVPHETSSLPEAGVPYDIVLDMEEITDFSATYVVPSSAPTTSRYPGALDIPPESPSTACPCFEVMEGKTRHRAETRHGRGTSGVENPLFHLEHTRLLFG